MEKASLSTASPGWKPLNPGLVNRCLSRSRLRLRGLRLRTVEEVHISQSSKKVSETPSKLASRVHLPQNLLETKLNARIHGSKVVLKSAEQNSNSASQSIIHSVLWESTRLLEAFLDNEPTDAHRIARANTTDQFGRTPLHYACATGFKAGVLMLTQVGANPRLTDSAGRTALHYAAWTNDASILPAVMRPKKVIQQHHKNYHSVARLWTFKHLQHAKNAQTELIQSTQACRVWLHVEELPKKLRTLVEAMTPLHRLQASLPPAASLVDVVDKEGRTPLFHAAIRGNVSLVTELLKLGACPKHEDMHGKRPSEVTRDAAVLTVFVSFLKHTQ